MFRCPKRRRIPRSRPGSWLTAACPHVQNSELPGRNDGHRARGDGQTNPGMQKINQLATEVNRRLLGDDAVTFDLDLTMDDLPAGSGVSAGAGSRSRASTSLSSNNTPPKSAGGGGGGKRFKCYCAAYTNFGFSLGQPGNGNW